MARIDVPFVIEKQHITQPTHEKLVAGGQNYFYATFKVCDTWEGIDGLKAIFTTNETNRVIDLTATESGYECKIPWEVMSNKGVFHVGIFGGDRMLTNWCYVVVLEGCVCDGSEPLPPTPDWFDEIEKTLEALSKVTTNLENGEGEVSVTQTAWEEEASNTAKGKGAVALGGYNHANAKCSMAVNYDNTVDAEKAFVCGSHNTIEEAAEGAFVAGHGNTAKSTYQTILGSYASVWEEDSLVIGNGSSDAKRGNALRVSKEGDVDAKRFNASVGINTLDATVNNNLNVLYKVNCNTLEAHAGATFGSGAITKRHDSYGTNEVTGAGSSAFGGNNKVYGGVSTAIGTSNVVPEGLTQVFIAGHMCEGATSRQAVFGSYSNATVDDMLVVGNGNSAKRKNALEVKRNGNLVIGGNTITIGTTTITEDQLKKILALINN